MATAARGSRRTARAAKTPRAAGFAMPAEWAPHRATWLSWPWHPVTWPGRRLAAVEGIYARMVSALAAGETVEVLVKDAARERRARDAVAAIATARARRRVRFHRVRTVDTWIRDYGPTFLVRSGPGRPRRAFVRWRFNAWGRKYRALLKDDGIPERLGLRLPRFAPGVVLEGGSIDVDGEGTCLTTEECLLNANRNPHLSREEVEEVLRENLGVSKVLWLGRGIAGDDTDGHVDDITRFVAPGVVVTAYEDDPRDRNHEPLRENWARLKTMRDARGRRLRVLRLSMPSPLFADGRRLPASYANFYVGNAVVLLPVYGDRVRDRRAVSVLSRCFPGRTVVPIDCTDLVFGYGSIHCVTQQEPA